LWTIFPGYPWTVILPNLKFHVTRITGVSHQYPADILIMTNLRTSLSQYHAKNSACCILLNSHKTFEISSMIVPILQNRKLRGKELSNLPKILKLLSGRVGTLSL
jgi:hypothetical protein